MLPFILLVIAASVLIYVYTIKPFKYWKARGVKHNEPTYLFGDTFKTAIQQENFVDLVTRLYKSFKNERYFGWYQFNTPILMINDLELIKNIGIKDFDHFHDHVQFSREDIDPIWSKNLFASNGEKWRNMRNTLSPSFTSSKMKMMFNLLVKCSEQFVLYYKEQDLDVVTVEMKNIFSRYTNDVIATTAFGITCDSLREDDNDFYKKGLEIMDFTGLAGLKFFTYQISPFLTKLLKLKIIPTAAADFFSKVIKDSMKMREEKGIVRMDMIHLLMEARKGNENNAEGLNKVNDNKKCDITDEDIIAQAIIFFVAGFDTSSTLMCFVAYELAVNQNIQVILREEIKEADDSCNGLITYEAVMKLKYLDMVISETLRKWPPTPVSNRVCTKEYIIEPKKPGEKPLLLEKGQVVWFPIIALQNDPDIYEEPERFDPERFSDKNKSNIDPSAFITFGIGPRNCIGSRFAVMETKILIYQILKHFEIVPVEKSVIPVELSKVHFNLTAKDGMWLGLKKLKE